MIESEGNDAGIVRPSIIRQLQSTSQEDLDNAYQPDRKVDKAIGAWVGDRFNEWKQMPWYGGAPVSNFTSSTLSSAAGLASTAEAIISHPNKAGKFSLESFKSMLASWLNWLPEGATIAPPSALLSPTGKATIKVTKGMQEQSLENIDPEYIKALMETHVNTTMQAMNTVIGQTDLQRPQEASDNYLEYLSNNFWDEMNILVSQDIPRAFGSSAGFVVGSKGLGALGKAATAPVRWGGKALLNGLAKAEVGAAEFAAVSKGAKFQKIAGSLLSKFPNMPQGLRNMATVHLMTAGESGMEANEMFNTVMANSVRQKYQDNLISGMDKDEALSKAVSDSEKLAIPKASQVFVDNYAMLLLTNSVELSSLQMLKGSPLTKFLERTGPAVASNFISEGFEEGYQYGVQKYVESNNKRNDTFGDAAVGIFTALYDGLKKGDYEAYTSIMLGGIAGGATTGMGRAMGVVNQKLDDKYAERTLQQIKTLGTYKKYKNFQDQYEVDKDGNVVLKDETLAQLSLKITDSLRKQGVAQDMANRGNWMAKSMIENELLGDMMFEYMEKFGDPKTGIDKIKEFFIDRDSRFANALSKEKTQGADKEAEYRNEFGDRITFDQWMKGMETRGKVAAEVYDTVERISKKKNSKIKTDEQKKDLFTFYLNLKWHNEVLNGLKNQYDQIDDEDPLAAENKEAIQFNIKNVEKVIYNFQSLISEVLKSGTKTETKPGTTSETKPGTTSETKPADKTPDVVQTEAAKVTGLPIKDEAATAADEVLSEAFESVKTIDEAKAVIDSQPEENRAPYEKKLGEIISAQRAEASKDKTVDTKDKTPEQIKEEQKQIDEEKDAAKYDNKKDLENWLNERYDETNTLLQSKEKSDVRDQLRKKSKTFRTVEENRDQLLEAEKAYSEGRVPTQEQLDLINTMPKFVQDVVTGKDAKTGVKDLTDLSNAGLALWHMKSPKAARSAIDSYFTSSEPVTFKSKEEEDAKVAEKFAEPKPESKTKQKKEKEELVPQPQGTQGEIQFDGTIEPTTPIPPIPQEDAAEPTREGNGVISYLFKRFTEDNPLVVDFGPDGLQPLPFLDPETKKPNFWQYRDEQEHQAAVKLMSSGRVTEGTPLYIEVDTSLDYYRNNPDFTADKMVVQMVAYTKDGQFVEPGTEGAERVVVGMLKNPANSVKSYKEELSNIRVQAYNAVKSKDPNTDIVKGLGTLQVDKIPYRANITSSFHKVETAEFDEFIQGRPHRIVYPFENSHGVYYQIYTKADDDLDEQFAAARVEKVAIRDKKSGKVTGYAHKMDVTKMGFDLDPKKNWASPLIVVRDGNTFRYKKLSLAKLENSPTMAAKVKDLLSKLTPANAKATTEQLQELVNFDRSTTKKANQQGHLIAVSRDVQAAYPFSAILPKNMVVKTTPDKQEVRRYDEMDHTIEVLSGSLEGYVRVSFSNPQDYYTLANLDSTELSMPKIGKLRPALETSIRPMIEQGYFVTSQSTEYPFVQDSEMAVNMGSSSTQISNSAPQLTEQEEYVRDVQELEMLEAAQADIITSPVYRVLTSIPKIRSDSAQAETGGNVGFGEDINPSWLDNKKGVSVERAAEDIWEREFQDTGELTLDQVRDIIIDALTKSKSDILDGLTKESKIKALRSSVKAKEAAFKQQVKDAKAGTKISDRVPLERSPNTPQQLATFEKKLGDDSLLITKNTDETMYLNRGINDDTYPGKPVEYDRVSARVNGEMQVSPDNELLLKNASELGTRIDDMIRLFFRDGKSDYNLVRDIMNEDTHKRIVEGLQYVMDTWKQAGFDIVPAKYHPYDHNLRVAGETDLMAFNRQTGHAFIIDIKSFRDMRHSEELSYKPQSKENLFVKRNQVAARINKVSTRLDKWERQQNTYRILLENTYDIKISGMFILPIGIAYKPKSNTEVAQITSAQVYEPFDLVRMEKVESKQEGKSDIVPNVNEGGATKVEEKIDPRRQALQDFWENNRDPFEEATRQASFERSTELNQLFDKAGYELNKNYKLSDFLAMFPDIKLPGITQQMIGKLDGAISVQVVPAGDTFFSPVTNTIYLSEEHLLNRYTGVKYEGMSPENFLGWVVAHEIGHSYTSARLKTYDQIADTVPGKLPENGFTKAEIDTIMKLKRLHEFLLAKGFDGYAMKNEREMIAEFLRDPLFTNKLKTVSMPVGFDVTGKGPVAMIKRLINKMLSYFLPGKTAYDYLNEIDSFFQSRATQERLKRDRDEFLSHAQVEQVFDFSQPIFAGSFDTQEAISTINKDFMNVMLDYYANIYKSENPAIAADIRKNGIKSLLSRGISLNDIFDDIGVFLGMEISRREQDIAAVKSQGVVDQAVLDKATSAEHLAELTKVDEVALNKLQGYRNNLQELKNRLVNDDYLRRQIADNLPLTHGVSAKYVSQQEMIEQEAEALAEQEDKEEINTKENWQQDYAEVDPYTNASRRVRFVLGNIKVRIYNRDENGKVIGEKDSYAIANTFGRSTYMDPMATFYTLVDILSKADSITEMKKLLESAVDEHPWVLQVIKETTKDEGLAQDLWTSVSNWAKIPFMQTEVKQERLPNKLLSTLFKVRTTTGSNKVNEVLSIMRSKFYSSNVYRQFIMDKPAAGAQDTVTETFAKFMGWNPAVLVKPVTEPSMNDPKEWPVYQRGDVWYFNRSAGKKEFFAKLNQTLNQFGVRDVQAYVQSKGVYQVLNPQTIDFNTMYLFSLAYADNRKNGIDSIRALDMALDSIEKFQQQNKAETTVNKYVKAFTSELKAIRETKSKGPKEIERLVDAYAMVGLSLPREQMHTLLGVNSKTRDQNWNLFLRSTHVSKIVEGLTSGKDIVGSREYFRALISLAKPIASATQSQRAHTWINVEGSRRFDYVRPNVITDIFYKTLSDPTKVAKFVADRTRYVFHKHAPIYEMLKNGVKLKLLIKDGYKKNGDGKLYKNYNEYDIYVLPLIEFHKTRISQFEGASQGTAVFDTTAMSDSSTRYSLVAPVFEGQKDEAELMSNLIKVVKQEYQRIESARPAYLKEYNDNAGRFHFFTTMNNAEQTGPAQWLVDAIAATREHKMTESELNRKLQEAIRDELNQGLKLYIQKLVDLGILTRGEKLTFNQGTVDDTMVPEDAFPLIRTYYQNQFFYNTQFQTLIGLDPAFYETPDAIVKRIKGNHTPGIFGDDALSADCLVIDEMTMPSSDEIQRLSREAGGKSFTKNNLTDGGSFVTLDYQIKKLRFFQEITPEQERVYAKIKNGEPLTDEDGTVTFKVNKPHQMYHNTVEVNPDTALLVPVQIKNSEAVLSPVFAYALKEGGYAYPEMGTDYSQYENPISARLLHTLTTSKNDKALFTKNIKTGLSVRPVSMDEVTPGNENLKASTFNVPGRVYKKAQDATDKFRDKMVRWGSQIARHAFASLDVNKTYSVVSSKNSDALKERFGSRYSKQTGVITMTGREIIDNYQSMFAGEIRKISAKIAKESIRDEERAFNPAVSKKAENKFVAAFKDALHIKVPGMALVNTPALENVVTDRELKTYIDKETGAIVYQARVPRWTLKAFGKEMPEEALKAFFYRIPTEDSYSTFRVEVVGFLPDSAGAVIHLPSEFTEQSDADFDFDKVFGIIKSMVEEIPYQTLKTVDDLVVNSEGGSQFDQIQHGVRINALRSYYSGEVEPGDIDPNDPLRGYLEQATAEAVKAGINTDSQLAVVQPHEGSFRGNINLLIDMIHSVGGDQNLIDNTLQGASFQLLKDLRQEYMPKSSSLGLAHPITLMDKTYNNIVGAGYISIFANTQGAHTLITQFGGIPLKFPILGHTRMGNQMANDGRTTITRNLSIGLNASVENSKVSLWSDLGVNDKTVGVVSLLIAMGESWEDTIAFVNNPAVKKFISDSNIQETKGNNYFYLKEKARKLLKASETRMPASLRTAGGREALNLFLSLDAMSSDYVGLTQMLKPDAAKMSGGLPEVMARVLQLQNYENKNHFFETSQTMYPSVRLASENGSPFLTATITSSSSIPMIDAYYKVYTDILNKSVEVYPYMHEVIVDGILELELDKADQIRDFANDAINAMLQRSSRFGIPDDMERQNFIKSFPMRFYDYLSQDKQTAGLVDMFSFKPDPEFGYKLELINAINVDDDLMNEMRNAMSRLSIVDDFVKYVINTTGLKFSFNSLSFLIPTYYDNTFFRTVEEYSQSNDTVGISEMVLQNNLGAYSQAVPLVQELVPLKIIDGETVMIFSSLDAPYVRAIMDKKQVLFKQYKSIDGGAFYTKLDTNNSGVIDYYDSPSKTTFGLPSEEELESIDLQYKPLIEKEIQSKTQDEVMAGVENYMKTFYPDVQDINGMVKTLTGKDISKLVADYGSFESVVSYIMKKSCG